MSSNAHTQALNLKGANHIKSQMSSVMVKNQVMKRGGGGGGEKKNFAQGSRIGGINKDWDTSDYFHQVDKI